MRHFLKTYLAIITVMLLTACGSHDKQSTSTNAYKVKPQSLHKTLHFTGIIQPIHENTISSPMEAVVESMNFHYGQLVKKGDVILILNSAELQKQYNDTLTDYLKAKDSYSVAQAKFIGTKELWDAGLMSKNNFLSEKSSLNNVHVTLMQATHKLTELLDKMDDNNFKNVSSLSLADFDKLKQLLASNHNLIKIKAPNDGVMLYPPKSSEDKSAKISVGSSVKSGQVLALIGDLSGISIEIDVPEVDIDKIRTGMTANITGVAFGQHLLKGSLVAVNAQASNTSSAGLPSFTAVVEVKTLTLEQQPWVKVGMSASIELNVDSDNQLLIPIAAVKREKGNSIVQIQLAQGSVQKRIVTTGPAQADSVVIESGLKSGDVVVYD